MLKISQLFIYPIKSLRGIPLSSSIVTNGLKNDRRLGVIGGAVFTVIFGSLLDYNAHYPQNAILILIPFYLVLFLYAKIGYRIERWNLQSLKKAMWNKG